MRRRLLLLLLPLFMLFAQQGAAWHELSHYRFDSNPADSTTSKKKQPQPAERLCDECLAFSGIAGAAAPHVPVLELLSFEHSLAPAEAVHAAATDAPSPRSRGPPLFL